MIWIWICICLSVWVRFIMDVWWLVLNWRTEGWNSYVRSLPAAAAKTRLKTIRWLLEEHHRLPNQNRQNTPRSRQLSSNDSVVRCSRCGGWHWIHCCQRCRTTAQRRCHLCLPLPTTATTWTPLLRARTTIVLQTLPVLIKLLSHRIL